MTTYEIVGKNKSGEAGSWEIEAEDKDTLKEILRDRGIQAESIDGEGVKRVRPKTLREDDENGV